MTTKDNGGQAFPTHPILYSSGDAGEAQGMTLRDYFAGQALAGMMTVENIGEMAESHGMRMPKFVATVSYAVADAMLAARATA